MNYAKRLRELQDRHDLIADREYAKDMLRVANDEVLDSTGKADTVLEPKVIAKNLKCKLKFTVTPTKQTTTPIGESKLKAIVEVG